MAGFHCFLRECYKALSLLAIGCVLTGLLLKFMFHDIAAIGFFLLTLPVIFIAILVLLASAFQATQRTANRLLMIAALIASGMVFQFMLSRDPTPVRAKISRTKADLRSYGLALEAYRQEQGAYPASFATLTTPVAYLAAHRSDIFAPVKGATYSYWHNGADTTSATACIVWSPGPDRVYDLTINNAARAWPPAAKTPSAWLSGMIYDPSNGSVSGGDLCHQRL